MIGYFNVYNEDLNRQEWKALKILARRKINGFDVCFVRKHDYKKRLPIYAYDNSTGICINHLCSILGNCDVERSAKYAQKLLNMYGGRDGKGFALEIFQKRAKDVFGVRKKQSMDYITLKKYGII